MELTFYHLSHVEHKQLGAEQAYVEACSSSWLLFSIHTLYMHLDGAGQVLYIHPPERTGSVGHGPVRSAGVG
jgi:hypothetical protein